MVFFHNFYFFKLIPLFTILNVATLIFILSIIGIIWNLKNLLVMLLCVELLFFSINLQFLFVASQTSFFFGYIYALINLILAAAESVIGLTILILLFKVNETIDYDNLTSLRH